MRTSTFILIATALALAAPLAEAKKGKGQGGGSQRTNQQFKSPEHPAEHPQKHEQEQVEEKLRGVEKQTLKKAEQERKELGHGSEKGQAMREEHSRKWWKFGFGKDEPETPEVPEVPEGGTE